jgi:hypothetical protein
MLIITIELLPGGSKSLGLRRGRQGGMDSPARRGDDGQI